MFITEKQLLIRASRLMVREGNVRFGSIKPLKGKLGGFNSNPQFSNENGVIMYDKINMVEHSSYVRFYVGELHVAGHGHLGLESNFKNWHHVYGICVDGTLILWAN